jgi:hypothetical protein
MSEPPEIPVKIYHRHVIFTAPGNRGLLRRMNVFVAVALADLHEELEPHYSAIGRPSIDPELHSNPPAATSKNSTTAVHAISTTGH